MTPRTASISLTRALPPAAQLGAWQRNPLRLTLTMSAGEDIADAEMLRVELRAAQASGTVLAAVNTSVGDGEGPWTVDLTAAQMSQSLTDASKTRQLWLEISALYSSGRIETLAARQVTLHRTGDVTESVPAAPSAFQTATLTQTDAVATLTIGSVSITFPCTPL